MNTVLACLVLLVASTAAADRSDPFAGPPIAIVDAAVSDPGHTIDGLAIFRSVDATGFQDCDHPPELDVLVWIVFDRGRVTSVDAGGSGDRTFEACVVRAIRTARLDGTKARVAATLELAASAVPQVVVGGTGTGTGTGNSSTLRARMQRGSATITGALSARQIGLVAASHEGGLRACFAELLATHDRPAATAIVHVEIDAAGAVVRAETKTQLGARFDECIGREVKRWSFPPASSSTAVELPLAFDTK